MVLLNASFISVSLSRAFNARTEYEYVALHRTPDAAPNFNVANCHQEYGYMHIQNCPVLFSRVRPNIYPYLSIMTKLSEFLEAHYDCHTNMPPSRASRT
ncbi:hypothetical protein BKA59DRAFT_480895 [Fusarium tricinctum]|uniref:Uncharacterized protein n=1 Tax=Fusarium tricinctum TaxID=61284 RepID=A0A8K0RS18_9HYPO|nr:hypothetical protein BKA59DRAFT_480895 [Fusarium tricinctum]